MASATPAAAVVSEVSGTPVGLQPRVYSSWTNGTLRSTESGDLPEVGFENPSAHAFENVGGNAVMHEVNTYVIYWDPAPHGLYHGDWREVIDTFMGGLSAVGSTNGDIFAVNGQYTDRTNLPAATHTSFKGSYEDTTAYPATTCTDPHPLTEFKPFNTKALACVTDLQVREHLQSFISRTGLPRGMSNLYYVLTPPGVTVCLDAGGAAGHCSDFEASEAEEGTEKYATESYKNSFCSYHGAINPGNPVTGEPSTVLYAMIPWSAGGKGDGQLAPKDRKYAYQCQDGAFDPTSKPIEQKEVPPRQQEPNQSPCPSLDGFCDTGLADVIINQMAGEQLNATIDPLLNAWQDTAKNESTDECRNWFAPAAGSSSPGTESAAGSVSNQAINSRHYYLNTAFNRAATQLNYPAIFCLPGIRLEPSFTAPVSANAGEVIGFDGMESDVTLDENSSFEPEGTASPNYATFTWNFGDGSPTVSGFAPGAPPCETPWLTPCAASEFHSYQYGGPYTISLTVKDVAGNTAVATRTINVAGPLPPSKSGGSSGGSGSGSGSSGSSTTATSTTTAASSTTGASAKVVPPPLATAAAVTHSLRIALRKGLVIRYSVNEQVAGHFEVLLSRTIAHRLGISGSPAVGLPAGTPPQVIIGRAVLVTTSAGRGTVVIQFSKRTASRLARLHSVPLMLRLFVRNAASHSPATTTVLSTVTLSH
jgi:hypothetical protein